MKNKNSWRFTRLLPLLVMLFSIGIGNVWGETMYYIGYFGAYDSNGNITANASAQGVVKYDGSTYADGSSEITLPTFAGKNGKYSGSTFADLLDANKWQTGSGSVKALGVKMSTGNSYEITLGTGVEISSIKYFGYADGTGAKLTVEGSSDEYAPTAKNTFGSCDFTPTSGNFTGSIKFSAATKNFNGIIILTVASAPSSPTFSVIYKDGETTLKTDNVKVGSYPAVYTPDAKACYTFSKWVNDNGDEVDPTTISLAANQSQTVYATWNGQYADGSNYTFENNATVGDKTVTTSSVLYDAFQIGNIYFSQMKIAYEDGTYSGSGDDFKGWKIKTEGATIKMLAQNDQLVSVGLGTLSSGCNISYTALDGSPVSNVAMAALTTNKYKVKAGTMVTLTTAGSSTVTLKSLKVDAIPAVSDDATLKELKYDGNAITLQNNVFDYNVSLPYGTTVVPALSAVKNDDNASAQITDATAFVDNKATSTVLVTAEDQTTTKTYNVNFTVESTKYGAEIIKATITGNSTATGSGYYYGSVATLNSSKKLGSNGNYVKFTLENGQTFAANDQVVFDVTEPNSASKIYFTSDAPAKDNAANANILATVDHTFTTGINVVTLPSDAVGKNEFYLYRVDKSFNPTINYAGVLRVMPAVVKTYTIAGVPADVDNTNHTITAEIAHDKDIAAAEAAVLTDKTYEAYANGGATVSNVTVNEKNYLRVKSAYAEDADVDFELKITKAMAPAETPNISAQPQGAEYEEGDDIAALIVSASVGDGGTLSYQWYKKADAGDDEKVGSNANSYTPDVAGTYYVIITNTLDGATPATATSDEAIITIKKAVPASLIYDFNEGVGTTDGTTGAPKAFTDKTSFKLDGNDQYIIITPASGKTFQNGDKVSLVGSCGSTSKKLGLYLATAADARTSGTPVYAEAGATEATGTLTLAADASALYLFRYDGTGTTITSLKVERVPSFSAANVEVEADATSGKIDYTINNPEAGATVSAEAEDGSWVTVGAVSDDNVAFTCTANQTSVERSTKVTLTYTSAQNDVLATKEVTVSQKAGLGSIMTVVGTTTTWDFTKISQAQADYMKSNEMGTWVDMSDYIGNPAVSEATYWSPEWCEGIQLGINQSLEGQQNPNTKARIYVNSSNGFYIGGNAASLKVTVPSDANTLVITATNPIESEGLTFKVENNVYTATVVGGQTYEIHRPTNSGSVAIKSVVTKSVTAWDKPTFAVGAWDAAANAYPVTISAQAGASIKYSVDGKATYLDYSAPVNVAANATIYAYATGTGLDNSEVAEKTMEAAPAPLASIKSHDGTTTTWDFTAITHDHGATLTGWTDNTSYFSSNKSDASTYWTPDWSEGVELGLNAAVSGNNRIRVYCDGKTGVYFSSDVIGSMMVTVPADAGKVLIYADNTLASNTEGVSFSADGEKVYVVSGIKAGDVFEIHGGGSTVHITKIVAEAVEAPAARQNMTAGELGTVCLPYAATVSNAKLYIINCKRVDGEGNPTAIALNEATSLEAGVPYIFEAEADGDVTFTYTGTTYAAAGSSNGLHGTYELYDFYVENGNKAWTKVSDKYYVIMNNLVQRSSWDGANQSGVIANRAYILMDEVPGPNAGNGAPARFLGIKPTDNPVMTGLDAISAEGENLKFFQNGKLYIRHNGQVYDAKGQLVK